VNEEVPVIAFLHFAEAAKRKNAMTGTELAIR
jgi:hypothetical protein